jgi:hypothetical protein
MILLAQRMLFFVSSTNGKFSPNQKSQWLHRLKKSRMPDKEVRFDCIS